MSVDTYNVLNNEIVNVKPLVVFHFNELLKNLTKRITKRPTNANPWKVVNAVKVPPVLFLKFYRALRDFKIRNFREISLKRKKDGTLKLITIKFTNIGPLRYHLGQAVGVTNKQVFEERFLVRHWPDGSKGSVVVTFEKPATLEFNMITNKLFFSANYEVVNNFGNVCL